MEILTQADLVESAAFHSTRLSKECAEFDRQLQIADDEGMFLREAPSLSKNIPDTFNPDPLIIAGDEGMFDRREQMETLMASGVSRNLK